MLVLLMACRREIPATVSLTADTGWEFDRTWSNGRRSSNREYFEEIVMPLALKYGIQAKFIRTVDKHGKPLPDLKDYIFEVARTGKLKNLNIPLFGSKKGQVTQRCTDKMKIRACRQELRRMGATSSCVAQGIHIDEAWRRVKGDYLRQDGLWSIYQTVVEENRKQPDGTRKKIRIPIKWLTHYYPLVDLKRTRRHCQEAIVNEKIPYLISSECDGCPWKDYTRWKRTDPGIIRELSKVEAMLGGQFFFTDKRIPLLQAIEVMREEDAKKPESEKAEPDFGCGNAECGI